MKQILNTKKILKATIALSVIVLCGCTSASDDEWGAADNYNYDNNGGAAQTDTFQFDPYPEQNEAYQGEAPFAEELPNYSNDEAYYAEQPAPVVNSANQAQDEPCVLGQSSTKSRQSLAASSPATPRVVPVKPAGKSVSCKTVQTKTAQSSTQSSTKTNQVTVKQKPAAPAVKVEQPKPAPAPVPEVKPEPPIVETTVENTATIDSNNANANNGNDFAIIDSVIEENVVSDVQENNSLSQGQNTSSDLSFDEQQMSADAQAERLAYEEQERMRLEQEMADLEAQRQALEEEKLRISQIQRTNTESCEDVKDWVAAEGTTLRSLLMDWGDRVGWRVVWNMDRDYTLEAGAVFRGRFVDVAAALLRSFARATPAPKGVFYKGNKVLVISTREDENAD